MTNDMTNGTAVPVGEWLKTEWCSVCGGPVDPFGLEPCQRCGHSNVPDTDHESGPGAGELLALFRETSEETVRLASQVNTQLSDLAWQDAVLDRLVAGLDVVNDDKAAHVFKARQSNMRISLALQEVREAIGRLHVRWELLTERAEQHVNATTTTTTEGRAA